MNELLIAHKRDYFPHFARSEGAGLLLSGTGCSARPRLRPPGPAGAEQRRPTRRGAAGAGDKGRGRGRSRSRQPRTGRKTLAALPGAPGRPLCNGRGLHNAPGQPLFPGS